MRRPLSRLPRLIAAALVFLCVAIPARAQEASSRPDEVTTTRSDVAVAPQARDDEIAARIQRILTATEWYSDLSVRVNEGIVFLDGEAATESRQLWARDLASKTSGVVAVVNRIALRSNFVLSAEPALQEARRLIQQFIAFAPLLLLSIIILPLAWIASRQVFRAAQWSMGDRLNSPFLRDIVARTIAAPVFLIGLYIVLQIVGLTNLALSLIGGAGVVGVVIGFAFRDIAENFLASLLLSMRQPFRAGDLILVDGRQGVVQSMNTRSTVLVSADGNHIQIPNAIVFKSVIENFTASPSRRATFDLGIAFDASIRQTQQIIRDVLLAHDAVLKDPEPMALVDRLDGSTVHLKAYYWSDGSAISPVRLRSALLRAVKRELAAAGVSMPEESRAVTFPDGVPVASAGGPSPPVAPAAPPDVEPPLTSEERDLPSATDDIAAPLARTVDGDDDDLLQGDEDKARTR